MNVKNAFLNGDLTKEVRIKPHFGYLHPPHKVCKLHCALYGLKQTARAWFSKFSTTIQQYGFHSILMIRLSFFDVQNMAIFSCYYTWMI